MFDSKGVEGYILWVLGKKRNGKKRIGNKRTGKKRTGKERMRKKAHAEKNALGKKAQYEKSADAIISTDHNYILFTAEY